VSLIFPLFLSIFASDILPIFIVAGVGFLLARFLGASVTTLSRVVFNALTPCLAFSLLVTSRMTGAQIGQMTLFTVLVTLAIGLVARVAIAPFRLPRPEMVGFLLVVMFSNNGNYGLPVVLFAFGQEALSYAAVYFVVSGVLVYTVGVFLAAAGRRSLQRAVVGIFKVPAIYGVLGAGLVVGLHLQVPLPLMRPIQLLADATLPMMMLVLGMQLERATVPDRPALIALAVGLSLLVAPVLALGLSRALGLAGAARQAAIVEASMPAAVITTILALEFDVAPSFVTSVVFASTVLSPFTLTALIAYLQRP
jgi:predicted permease